ncbi:MULTISPECIES: hypothetical protein [Methanobacterium]|uniref:Uncharacterized protein n=1 Tax=Methanobacterium bryantii TaxID=2161 RepID=A0A2A2H8L6_METBR|nr:MULTISPECIES: hypothetical protein [Methanobacterium]OEC87902.1 hypothetical protein A9507_06920 [Methanobacterium sp. A39]PAV05769.1 hypothetical protein ASJ80_08530 [Methanobacterium bryantii]
MVDIDTERLELAIKGCMDEVFWDKINFSKLVNNCQIVNDETAIQITGSNFVFIFDIDTYELIDGKGDDIRVTV